MGNCFGKESKKDDPFAQPGRTLGSASPQSAPARATIPSQANASAPPRVTGPGHTLGSSEQSEDPREAAARAAEARANKNAGSGTLEQQLAAQRKKGMSGALQDAAAENLRTREMDSSSEARNYN